MNKTNTPAPSVPTSGPFAGSLSRIKTFFRRPRSTAQSAARFQPEMLESRQLLSAGTVLTGVTLNGHLNSIDSVVLTFNAALNPASAQDVQTYVFGKRPADAEGDSFDVGSLFGFRAKGHEHAAKTHVRLVKNGKIQFSSAVYNDANHTVTLTPLAPFRAPAYFRYLKVRGTGTHALIDATQTAFNGGLDENLNWKLRHSKSVRYFDHQHDRITLKLHGPGSLYVFIRKNKDIDPLIFIDSATAATSVTAAVKFSDTGIKPINIAQLEGAAGVTNNLLDNPDFNVEQTTP